MAKAKVPTHTIGKGQQLYRVLAVETDENGKRLYTALDPNPFSYVRFDEDSNTKARYEDGTPVPGRFAPFRANAIEPDAVPTLYLAESAVGAYYEAMLRPLGGSTKRNLELAQVEKLALARLVLNDDLQLADCRDSYLQDGLKPFWPYTRDELYNKSNFKVMDNTRTLAKHIYDEYPQLDGLIWDSVQAQGPVTCVILFGDRRNGLIQQEVSALEDISTWHHYLLQGVANNQIVIAPDLISRLGQ